MAGELTEATDELRDEVASLKRDRDRADAELELARTRITAPIGGRIGEPLVALGAFLEADPVNIPTADMPLSKEYFRRVEAIEFAVKSDDGKDPRNFRKADLVLVGVSRTSKTPLSLILAQRGLKVANLPLVLGVSLPWLAFVSDLLYLRVYPSRPK